MKVVRFVGGILGFLILSPFIILFGTAIFLIDSMIFVLEVLDKNLKAEN